MDLKTTLEAMAAISKAHIEFCQATKSVVSSNANSAWIWKVEVTHKQATHQAHQADLGDLGDVTPVLPNLATRKAKLVSREI